jgi:hypothetical protein
LQYGTLLKLSKIPILAVAFFGTSIQPAYNPNSKVLPTPRGHKETANVTTEAQLKYHRGTTETPHRDHRDVTEAFRFRAKSWVITCVLQSALMLFAICLRIYNLKGFDLGKRNYKSKFRVTNFEKSCYK